MLFRARVREVAVELLDAAVVSAGATTKRSKDTPIPSGLTPMLVVYTDDVKMGMGTAPPTFRTDVLTTIEVTAEANTDEEAEDLCDTLCELVENTLLGDPQFVRLFEAIDSVATQITQKGVEARKHVYAAVIEIKAHATELFEPTIPTALTGMGIYVDSRNIYDAQGTYDPPFPYPVAPAPRDGGPDGRAEISGSQELPQE